MVSVSGHGQWLVDTGARSGGDPGSRRRRAPTISLDNRKTSIFAPTTGVFWAVRTQNVFASVAPPRPSLGLVINYYLLTRPGPRAPHWLLTGVPMSRVLTHNFGRMSFGGPFLVNPAMGLVAVRDRKPAISLKRDKTGPGLLLMNVGDRM